MNDIKTDPSCADDFDPNSLPVTEALKRIDHVIEPIAGYQQVPIRSALSRVLAQDVVSPANVPAHDNSAMDGYAVVSSDLPESGVVTLNVVGTALAGVPWNEALKPGAAVRIMTGAVIPQGADCVVMQEHAEREGDKVKIGSGYKAGQNLRYAGEDIKTGGVVLHTGRLVQASDVGVMASLGIAEVKVRRRIRVAFFSTGDELRSIGEPLGPGDVYDSNRYTLFSMLTRMGAEIIDLGVVGDRREDLLEAFHLAASSADAIITSGGVSVGEADFVKETLNQLGEVNFWKIAMKPGRPLAFGKVEDAIFFGLPGNPVSVMVTFYQFVLPALRRMTGQTETAPVLFKAPLAEALKKRPGRVEYQRGIMTTQPDGSMVVHCTGDQGSGILSSVSRANCFIILPNDCAGLQAGDIVDVQPFEGLI